MKVKRVLALILISALFMTGISINIYAEDNTRAARISDFSGSVKILKGGGEKEFKAFKGMSLLEGDRVTTGKDSWASLEIDDDKEVKLGENTQISLSELKGSIKEQDDRTGISLFAGKIWTSIKKALNVRSKYEIKTPTTVMGVRGTQFFVGQEEGSTDVAVLEGTVVATAYVPVEQPDGTSGQQEIEVVLEQNQQVTLDETVQSQEDVHVEQVTTDTLDLFVLQTIQEDPEGIDSSLLNGIDQVIEQRLQERQQQEQSQEQQSQNQGTTQQQTIVYEEEPAPPSPPSGYTPPPPPADGENGEFSVEYIDAYCFNGVVSIYGRINGIDEVGVKLLRDEESVDTAELSQLTVMPDSTGADFRFKYIVSELSMPNELSYEITGKKNHTEAGKADGDILDIRCSPFFMYDSDMYFVGSVFPGPQELKIRLERIDKNGTTYPEDVIETDWKTVSTKSSSTNMYNYSFEIAQPSLPDEIKIYQCVLCSKQESGDVLGVVTGYIYITPDGINFTLKRDIMY